MPNQTHPLVGTVVDGRYRVESFIARGGMATVYCAVDLRLDRTVALKVMHASLAEDPEFVQRFVREARSAASLSHPTIVAVYDQGSADATVYLAMEYVAGRTLRDLITERGHLDPATALGVMEPVLEALTAAHQAGIAHRDIKPENVLIARNGQVKVADFGLARAIAANTSTAATQGMLIGTVAYLAPEQVESGLADARSDVYSAGILLYECLVGQPPYSGETPLSVAYQHVNGTVSNPSSIHADIPPSIDELVAIATRRDPATRYTDAADFVQHLRTVRALIGNPSAPLSAASAQTNTVILDRSEPPQGLPTANSASVSGGTALATAMLTDAARPVVSPARPSVTFTDTSPHDLEAGSYPPSPPDPDNQPFRHARRPRRFRVLIAALILVLLGSLVGASAWWWGASQYVSVPTLVGLTPEQATAKLASQDIKLDVTGQDYSATIPKGAIVAIDPSAGSEVRKGDSIDARTSAGPPTVAIPKMAGLTAAKAAAKLKSAGLAGKSQESFSDSVAGGLVISTVPKGGTTVKIGETVLLLMSKGPPPVTVPNVVTMDRNSAVAKLQGLGLKVSVRNQLPVVVFGRVYSQSPGGGAVVDKGSTITITIV